MHFALVGNEAGEVYVDATAVRTNKDYDACELAYDMWVRIFVTIIYGEQIKEELYMLANRRDKNFALCYRHMKDLTLMMSDRSSSAVILLDEMLARYLKRAMSID